MKFQYQDAQGMGQQHPNTFEVASIDHLREVVQPGVFAKICILDDGGARIWTKLIEVDDAKLKATFANEPFDPDLKHGDPVEYELRHIYNVQTSDGEDLA